MNKHGRAFLLVAAGLLCGLTLAAGASGTTAKHASRLRHVQGRIEALAMDGSRIAYDAATSGGNRVLVWDTRSGRTTTVSGRQTRGADDSSTGSGVYGLAIAGSRVAWLVNVGGNIEGDDYLFASSTTHPKERKVASETRSGDTCSGGPPAVNPQCSGKWLLSLVGSGSVIALDRYTTGQPPNPAPSASLLVLDKNVEAIASGTAPFQPLAVDSGRIAVLHGLAGISLYTPGGKVLQTVPTAGVQAAALSGRNLVVLTTHRTLELFSTTTRSLRRTFETRGTKAPRNLGVEGDVAIYTTGSAVHAVDLSSGKDRVVAEHRGGPLLADIDRTGLVYGGNGYGNAKATLLFVPLARVTAAVG